MGSKLIERFYIGFFVLLPLLFCNSIVDPVLLPRQILLSAFLLLLVVTLQLKKIVLPFRFTTPLFIVILSFLSLNLISFYQSGVISESHAVFSKLVLLFSFFTLTTLLLNNDILSFKKIVPGIILLGFISFSFSFYEIIEKSLNGQHLLRQVDIIKGNSANKNLLSSILFLCLPFYCIGLKENKTIRYLSIIGITATLFILVTIRTRAVLIACGLFFLLLFCYWLKQKFSIKKRSFLAAGFVFLGLLFSVYKGVFEDKIANLHSSSSNIIQQYLYRLFASETLKTRLQFWNNSIQMAKEHPIFGVGLGNWQLQFPKYGLNNFQSTEIINGINTLQRPHNDFIWILCETGILGVTAYLSLFGVIIYQLIQLIKRATEATEKWTFYFIFAAVISYLFIAFFDFPYERIEHQVVLMTLFAMVTSSYYKKDTNPITKRKPILLLCLLPIGYSFLVSFSRYNGEAHAVKMYIAKSNKDWPETVYEAKKATNYFYRIDNTTIPLSWYEGIGYFNQNQMEDSESCFYKAYQLNPYNIQVINNLASVYQVNGKTDEAVALYKEALVISNHFDEAKLNLAALYFNRKDFEQAYHTINEVTITTKNPKYNAYLVPILNQKINAFLKSCPNKEVVAKLVKNVTTKERLLQLFFDAKKAHLSFEAYCAQVTF